MFLTFSICFLPLLGLGADETDLASQVNAAWTTYNQGDLEGAKRQADAILAEHDDSAWTQLLRGKIEEDEGGYGDDYLIRAAELAGDDRDVVANIADTWATRYAQVVADNPGQAEDARVHAEHLYLRWQELEPESAVPLQRLAFLKSAGGDRDAAIGLLCGAVANDPGCDPAHADLWGFLGSELPYERLAAFYYALSYGRYEDALRARCADYQGQLLANLVETKRIQANAHAESGNISARASTLQEAREVLSRAVACFDRAGDIDDGYRSISSRNRAYYLVTDCELLGELSPLADLRDPEQRVDAKLPLAFKRAFELAKSALLPLLAESPDDGGLQLDMDRLSFALFQASGGEGGSHEGMNLLTDLWTDATADVTTRADWFNNLGFFGREAGRYEESYAAYSRSIELAPDNVRYLNDTGLILLYHLDRDLDHARQLFQRADDLGKAQYPAVKEDPAQEAELRSAWGDAMLNLGRLATQEGRFDDAHAAFDRLGELDAGRWDLLTSRVELALAEGKPERLEGTIAAMAERLAKSPDDRLTRAILREIRTTLSNAGNDAGVAPLISAIDRALQGPRADDSGR